MTDAPRFKPYPIVLTNLVDALCVVVGGGSVALRKATALLQSGARVRVISPELHENFGQLHETGRIEHVARAYAHGDLAGATLAIAATDRRDVNAQVAEEARLHGILCNIADDPEGSDFHTLAAVWRGDVLLAASTGGESPALAAHLRRKLEATFGPEYAVLAERLGHLRRTIAPALPPAVRRELWRSLATDEALALLRNSDPAQFDAFVADHINQTQQTRGDATERGGLLFET